MFSRKEQLIQRTGKSGVGRRSFLNLLVTEFHGTKSRDGKEQVLANLANFAYDPVNYDYLRELKVIKLFLETLSENNKILVRFAVGGICNLCSDPENREYVLRNQGIPLVSSLLSSPDEETVLSAITTLMFLITPPTKPEIASPQIINCMINVETSQKSIVSNIKPGSRVSILRVITKEDVHAFAQLTNDYNPIHVNSERNIAHGAFLNGLLSGILGTKLPGPGTLVVDQVLRFPKPCFVGDTVELSVEIVSMRAIISIVFLCIIFTNALENKQMREKNLTKETKKSHLPIGCYCGVFMSGQFKKGSKEQPNGNPALLQEHSETFPCNPVGNKICINRCLEIFVKHLPNSQAILCGSMGRDCVKERAYLFVKNCKDVWINSNLSPSREYCCKDGNPYKCPP
ncbi:uncharacterized protein LOC117180079 [Belonocnema kinseyi]|uniref:uncharacterized protein LOC117180079 n=1 Tax=Belonocnema kinseyi TaxID=2817044 RepID=UPI00143D629C|nr:uncharacterized protein LOC117180079 [Belonocnema kinseyi]